MESFFAFIHKDTRPVVGTKCRPTTLSFSKEIRNFAHKSLLFRPCVASGTRPRPMQRSLTPNFLPMKLNRNLHLWLTVGICFVLSLACIVLALPREAKFGYSYEIGQPWSYPPLIATFEFPIDKTPDQLKVERDSVLQEFHPYFNARELVGQQQIKNFKSDYARGAFNGVPLTYVQHALNMLSNIYGSGMVDSEEFNHLSAQNLKGIRVVSGTSATARPLSALFSPRTAYEYAMHQEQFSREIMSRLNLHKYLVPNLVYDSLRTHEGREEALATVSTSTGMVLAGERIIDRGERVSPRQYSILESLRRYSEHRKNDGRSLIGVVGGQVGLVGGFLTLLLIFLYLFRRDLYTSPHSLYLIFSLVTLFPVLTSLLVTYKFFSVYIIPFAMVPFVIRVFMDTRTAFLVHILMVCLAAIPLHSNYLFFLTQLVSGLVTLFTIRDLTERSQLMRTALIVTLCTWAFGLCQDLAQGTTLTDIDRSWYWYIGINGVALLFTYPLLYLIERLFGFTSSVTLIEMNNTNTPLIRRMAREANGTYVHSQQVGSLAAEVAAKIGANVQLVRTAALYHDIGKMLNPAYFTENQGGINPHDQLTEERSAEIIISHVTEGVRLAEKHGIPKLLREFIVTHHGSSMVKYFYIQACNKYGADKVDPKAFTYPGRNPYTREQAILMMADAIEASSRSLKEYSDEAITELVNRIVDSQVESGYFRECPITFRDISDAKRVFAESLKTIYHTRIAYPTLNQPVKADDDRTAPQRPHLFGSNTWRWKK